MAGPKQLGPMGAVVPIAAPITGSMLSDLVSCEHRVGNDLHADQKARAPVTSFVELLWRNGCRHETKIIAGLGNGVVDLRAVPLSHRTVATLTACASEAKSIVGGRLELGDRIGMPDILLLEAGGYHAGEITSGSPFAANCVDPKKGYAARIGFCARLLVDLELGGGDRAFVIGDDGVPVWFDLSRPISRGGESIADWVEGLTTTTRGIREGSIRTTPAAGATCSLCVWKALCQVELAKRDDPTLIAGLGRSTRASLAPIATTVTALAAAPLTGAPAVAGIGEARLATFVERARMLRTPGARPYATRALGLDLRDHELHLDLETDPTSGNFCYLHGIHERMRTGSTIQTHYVYFLAETRAMERDAFAAAIEYLDRDPHALITTFSAFERSTYRVLQRRYPEVATEQQVEAIFASPRGVDIYFDAVLPATVWPLPSMGLKSIARYLGFDWSDHQASGAASIGWFVEYAKNRDPRLLDRILKYNSDDTVASAVVFDGLLDLPVGAPLPWPPAALRAGCESEDGDRSTAMVADLAKDT